MTETADLSVLGGLLAYLLVMVGIGVWSCRHMRSLDDFAIAGRRLGPWVTAISERASGESAWFLLGLPGAAYALGFTEFWSVIGIAFGIFASWTLIARPLRRETERLGAITLPEYLELRFEDRGHFLRLLSTVVILFFYTIYVGAQFIGAGKILNATFGVSTTGGMLIGAGVVVAYTLLGGFLAVAWTDLVQGLMMAAVSLFLPILAIVALGGPDAFVQTLADQGEGFLSMSGGKAGAAFFFGVMVGNLSWGFGYLGQPHLLVRYMAIRSTREIRHSTGIAMAWVLLAYWGVVFVGLAAVGILGTGVADPEQVMPLMARALLPGWLAGLFIAGAVAAMMSTADSQLLVAASSLVEDVYTTILGRQGTREQLLLMSRIATVLVAGVALLLAFASKDLIYDLVAYAWSGLGASFGPPLVLALWWRGTTRAGAVAGMAGGLVTSIVWKNAQWIGAEGWTDVLDIKWLSFAVSLALVVAVSLATRGASRAEGEPSAS